MKHLLTIHESDIYLERERLNHGNFKTRHAARAVVLNSKGEVALLNARTFSYHKLPGGGVESGEDMDQHYKESFWKKSAAELWLNQKLVK